MEHHSMPPFSAACIWERFSLLCVRVVCQSFSPSQKCMLFACMCRKNTCLCSSFNSFGKTAVQYSMFVFGTQALKLSKQSKELESHVWKQRKSLINWHFWRKYLIGKFEPCFVLNVEIPQNVLLYINIRGLNFHNCSCFFFLLSQWKIRSPEFPVTHLIVSLESHDRPNVTWGPINSIHARLVYSRLLECWIFYLEFWFLNFTNPIWTLRYFFISWSWNLQQHDHSGPRNRSERISYTCDPK